MEAENRMVDFALTQLHRRQVQLLTALTAGGELLAACRRPVNSAPSASEGETGERSGPARVPRCA